MTGACGGSDPVRVAVVGTGYFGSGLLRRLALLDGFVPRVAANRTLERALAGFTRAGVPRERIVVAREVSDAEAALDSGCYVATTDLLLPTMLEGIDVIAEATGDVVVGAEVACAAIRARKHVVAANPEAQATVGPILREFADEAGVVYTDVDGDEPGLLKDLVTYCSSMGLDVVLAGNCKGVLKRYATPETQAAFAAQYNLKPWMATAAADGTKLNFELTVVANATGFTPTRQGMFGPTTTPEQLTADFERLGVLESGPHVDYAHGLGSGVFAIVRSTDPEVQSDFRYLKMGNGPYYAFLRPLVLIHYLAPNSIRRAARFGEATVTPAGGPPVADTIAVAKHDLVPGQRLDGIGGFDMYGVIARSEDVRPSGCLPIGIAQYARVRRAIRKDAPIVCDDVEFDTDNLALQLRRKQDAWIAGGASTS
jgi:predicted homoserine dehydrogenase-like protein